MLRTHGVQRERQPTRVSALARESPKRLGLEDVLQLGNVSTVLSTPKQTKDWAEHPVEPGRTNVGLERELGAAAMARSANVASVPAIGPETRSHRACESGSHSVTRHRDSADRPLASTRSKPSVPTPTGGSVMQITVNLGLFAVSDEISSIDSVLAAVSAAARHWSSRGRATSTKSRCAPFKSGGG